MQRFYNLIIKRRQYIFYKRFYHIYFVLHHHVNAYYLFHELKNYRRTTLFHGIGIPTYRIPILNTGVY